MITLRIHDHILASRSLTTRETHGLMLTSYPNVAPDCVIVHNGRGMSYDAAGSVQAQPGDVVEVFPIPGVTGVGAGIAAIGTLLTATATTSTIALNLVLLGVGVGLQFLFAQDLPDPGGLLDSPRKPPFDGPKTQLTVGQIIPIVFGEVRVGGSIVSQSFFDRFELPDNNFGVESPKTNRISRQGQGLQTQLILALGEVSDVTQPKIDNIPIADVPGTVWTSRRGEPAGNSPIKAQDAVRNEIVKNVLVTNAGGAQVVETDNSVDGMELILTFPNGLFFAASNTKKFEKSFETWVRFTVRYRQKGAVTWITRVGSVLYTDQSLTAIEVRVDFPTLSRAVYEIEVTKTSSDKDVVGFSVNESKVPFPAGAGSDELRIGSIVEISKDDRLYPGFALGYVRQDSDEELAEIPRTFSFLVQGFNDIRIYSDLTNFTTGFTENPAWIAAYFITRTEFGLGKFFGYDANVDIASFLDWADFCDELVDDGEGGTETRCFFNHAYEVATPVLEILDDMARAGNAFLYHRASKWFAIPDRPDSRVTIFTESHTLDDGPIYRWRRQFEIPTRINAEFLNRQRDHFRDSLPVSRPDVTLESEHHDATQTFWGVDRASQVHRDALKLLRRLQLEDHEIEFTVGAIGRRVGIGQIFGMSMPSFSVGTASGKLVRVDSPTVNWVEIDGDVTLSVGPTWQMNIVHADGSTSLATLQNVGDSTFRFEATDPNDFGPAAVGDDFTIGVIQDYRCLDVNVTGDQKWKIVGAKYDPAIYNDAQLTPTQPAAASGPTSTAAPSAVKNLTALFDTTDLTMSVNWNRPDGFEQVRYEVFQRSDGNEGWILKGATTATHLDYDYDGDDETLDIAVQSISKSGARLEIGNSAQVQVVIPP